MGFLDPHRTWRHQMAAPFRGGYFCIAPDQRGYARSSKPQKVTDYAVPKLVAECSRSPMRSASNASRLPRMIRAVQSAGRQLLGRPERVERLIIANAPHPYVFRKC